jgi:hypothetical protein
MVMATSQKFFVDRYRTYWRQCVFLIKILFSFPLHVIFLDCVTSSFFGACIHPYITYLCVPGNTTPLIKKSSSLTTLGPYEMLDTSAGEIGEFT